MASPVVIYNPTAGRGRALQLVKSQSRLPPGAELLESRGPGDAVELTKNAIAAGCRWVLAAGGDGTVHEVTNGILASGDPDVLFTPLPFGSMNDYAFALGITQWWARGGSWDELKVKSVDVGTIRGGGRERHFVNCCGIGFNGMVTIEARKIRWLRGIPLYALGVMKAMVKHFRTPDIAVTFDDTTTTSPTLALTVGLGPREGGFPLTAAAKLDDGLFDVLQVGAIRRWELVRHLPGMISGNLPKDHPKLRFAQAKRIAIESPVPLCVHLDGEFFTRPEEGVGRFELEMIAGRLTVSAAQG